MPDNRKPHRIDLRVYYEDTDSGGIVYYANYLKFAERGRTEYLRDLGYDHGALMRDRGVGFAVRRCVADYRVPAVLDDALTVETTIVAVSGARFEMRQSVLRNDTILCEIAVTLACIDRQGRPVRLPTELRRTLDGNGLVRRDEEGKG